MFYREFFFTSSWLPTLRTRWTALNQTWPHVRKWVRFENVFEASPFPTKRGQNHLFGRFRNLTTNLTAYLRIETRLTCSGKYVGNCQRSRRLKISWTLVHKRLWIGPEFLPTLRKFCITLHCRTSQDFHQKRNSSKLCQTVDSRSR